jgi:hypothetical protein
MVRPGNRPRTTACADGATLDAPDATHPTCAAGKVSASAIPRSGNADQRAQLEIKAECGGCRQPSGGDGGMSGQFPFPINDLASLCWGSTVWLPVKLVDGPALGCKVAGRRLVDVTTIFL